MAANSFINFFDKAEGESTQKGMEKWVEIQGWDWDVEAESSWTKGGGASVGKPNPGKLNFQHFYDTASNVILGYICTGKAFPKIELKMQKASARENPENFFTMTMEGVFITRVSNMATSEGVVIQRVELVFKTVKIDYRPQDSRTGGMGVVRTFNWDIPAGTASPSA